MIDETSCFNRNTEGNTGRSFIKDYIPAMSAPIIGLMLLKHYGKSLMMYKRSVLEGSVIYTDLVSDIVCRLHSS